MSYGVGCTVVPHSCDNKAFSAPSWGLAGWLGLSSAIKSGLEFYWSIKILGLKRFWFKKFLNQISFNKKSLGKKYISKKIWSKNGVKEFSDPKNIRSRKFKGPKNYGVSKKFWIRKKGTSSLRHLSRSHLTLIYYLILKDFIKIFCL